MAVKILLAIGLVALWATMALSDIWQDCITLEDFCKRRSFHRDCVAHTAYHWPKCFCLELRDANGNWPRRDCNWTDDLSVPDLVIQYEPPNACLNQGREACN
jgi:hypothetical protein